MDTYETSLYTGILITASVLGCILVYFAFTVFRQQRVYIRAQRVNFSREIELLEEDRGRIGRDLHDELGPIVSIAKTHMEFAGEHTEDEKFHVQKSKEHLDELMKCMRQIAANLTPQVLERKGFFAALQNFFEELQPISRIELRLVYEVRTEIPIRMSLHLYRMVQEITHNALKHSKGSLLYVHLKERKGKLYLFGKDDGKGFAVDNIPVKGRGLGIQSLRSRTQMLGGQMKLRSSPDGGTEYFFEFPFKL